ncbi:MAG: tRNA pseudouridine(55) synthase TruB [Ignavibacteriae bacterium]|nr:MAG: tRNA pseudouridine(55) synthase TruB [Ignavibacteriota bacterium]
MLITNQTKQIFPNEISEGLVLLIDKPKYKTSFNIVSAVRKKLQIRKVGHAGTLDPLATGLLIVCAGKKTKEIYKYQDQHKVYEGIITLGSRTPSMDSETEPIEIKSFEHITNERIEEVKKKFIGEIQQIPPMYSALKHKGKSLYKYARKGIEIKREPRTVTIYDFEIKDINLPDIEFNVKCSKGTYIRVIADDFGKDLECGAHLSKLRRTMIGKYYVNNALSLEELSDIQVIV